MMDSNSSLNIIGTRVQYYPSAEELSKVITMSYCPEDGCKAVFSTESNLQMHIVKHHKRESLKKNELQREFYCPEKSCIYSEVKFFKAMKLLKQHYMKVHSEKLHLCQACQKGFPTEMVLKRHVEYCGVNFKCSDCHSVYSSYEGLMTHARRKKHNILEKVAFKTDKNISKCENVQVILPQNSANCPPLNFMLIQVKTSDNSSQTDSLQESTQQNSKDTQVCNLAFTENNSTQTCNSSIQTQTNEVELTEFSSSETQTTGNYFVKKIKRFNLEPFENDKCHNTTQTNVIDSHTKSCNTSFKEDMVDKTTMSTQTFKNFPQELLSSISTATHDSIHTDTSDLNFEFMDSSSQTNLSDEMNLFDSSSFFNCNIETQTDFMLDNNDLLNYNSYSDSINSQTQTSACNVFFNMETPYNDSVKECDVLFSNIHTQTVFDDVCRSVESQTIHFTPGSLMNCRDYANIETQTDIDFRNMLEQINA